VLCKHVWYLEYCLQLEHKPVARDGNGSAQKLSKMNSCLNSIVPARKCCCPIPIILPGIPIYPVLRSSSSVSSQVKVSSICTVYSMINTSSDDHFYKNLLASQMRFLAKVKGQVILSSLTTLTEDEDWSIAYIGVPHLLWIIYAS